MTSPSSDSVARWLAARAETAPPEDAAAFREAAELLRSSSAAGQGGLHRTATIESSDVSASCAPRARPMFTNRCGCCGHVWTSTAPAGPVTHTARAS